MNRISLFLLLSVVFCCVSCEPEKKESGSVSKSEPVVKTESAPKEEVSFEAKPVVTEPEKVETPKSKNPVIKMVTSMGEIDIELYADKAPITVENFLTYANEGFYNGKIFHRVIPTFMIQGGGITQDMKLKKTKAPIKNESYNQLRNARGTIAMARMTPPDSATCQFFINHKDNRSLDFDGPMKPGYAVFGKVISGMDVVDKIALVKTTNSQYYDENFQRNVPCQNVPVEAVIIESVTVME